MPVALLLGRRTRTLSGPLRPATSMSRASSRNTGAGKMPLPSRLARRDTSGGTEITGGWVAISASSCALNVRASSMSFCSMSGAAGRTVAIEASLFRTGLAAQPVSQVQEVSRLDVGVGIGQAVRPAGRPFLERPLDERGAHAGGLCRTKVSFVRGHHHHLARLEAEDRCRAQVNLWVGLVVAEVFGRQQSLERQVSEPDQRLLLGPIAVGERRNREPPREPSKSRRRIRPRRQTLPRV